MKRHLVVFASLIVLGITFTSGQQQALSQQDAPKGNKGLTATAKQAVDLGPEIEGMKDRQLRMRVLKIEPGGHIGIHSHKDRPSVAYFMQGVDTVTFDDGTEKVFRSGDTTSANHGTTHWHQNKGKEPVVLLIVDIFHKTK